MSPAELAAVAATVSATMLERCDILRTTSEANSGLGVTRSAPVVVAAGVPCRVASASDHSELLALIGRVSTGVTYKVALPLGTDLRPGDHIAVDRTPVLLLSVDAVAAPTFSAQVRVRCQEVT